MVGCVVEADESAAMVDARGAAGEGVDLEVDGGGVGLIFGKGIGVEGGWVVCPEGFDNVLRWS